MSEFWKKKMSTYFKRIDFDHDGVITKKDFEGMADRFIQTGKFDDGGVAVKGELIATWNYYANVAGVKPDDDKSAISSEVFVSSMQKVLADKDHPERMAAPLPHFFHAVDSNNDKMIDAGEYAKFFDILGLNPDMAPATFAAIDANNDGLLSLDEFREAGLLFFTELEDKSPSKTFWGPVD